MAPGISTVLTVCGLHRCDGLGLGLKGLGDARWLDVVEALDEPDPPTQTHSLVIGRGRHTKKKHKIAPRVLAPAESLIELATGLPNVLLQWENVSGRAVAIATESPDKKSMRMLSMAERT